MIKITSIVIIISYISVIESQMEPKVVGGNTASITDFPHSVFIGVSCIEEDSRKKVGWICGASILNVKVLLTAAHCMYRCSPQSFIGVCVGHADRKVGYSASVHSFIVHELYSNLRVDYDIGLLRLRTPLELNKKVTKVALMRDPPYYEKAQIAGWGMLNEFTQEMGTKLMFIDQYVWKWDRCKEVITNQPKGTICASSGDPTTYSSRGDSGSALVVRGYIQIGIVSYKVPKISRSLVVYTDTGYFYDWITHNTKRLYCA
ncbi:serine protease 52 isoform X1 [Helicoverpa armigera]|uniref:serine protease 52 isoform X1 n=1 Tax=Helicoverpa armigera TaxID=29058 RepID=UPI003083BAF7